jgi:hypothetical protein
MSPARPRTLTAMTDLRRTAAAVVELCDVMILGSEGDATQAMRALPSRVRALQFRAARALTALESEGITG